MAVFRKQAPTTADGNTTAVGQRGGMRRVWNAPNLPANPVLRNFPTVTCV
jgi:hypothetical protein